MEYSPDGRSAKVSSYPRDDAKNYDPRYEPVIREVREEVEAEMKEKGTYGQFGSGYLFGEEIKKRLKTRGIDWHSMHDLNPDIIFD